MIKPIAQRKEMFQGQEVIVDIYPNMGDVQLETKKAWEKYVSSLRICPRKAAAHNKRVAQMKFFDLRR